MFNPALSLIASGCDADRWIAGGTRMSKLVTKMIAMALVAMPAMAVAKDGLDPRVQSLLVCESISSAEARLQCFDQSIIPLKQALSRGRVVLKENDGPGSLGGVVTASGKSAEKRFWVLFENGDRWQINTQPDRRKAPPVGITLKIQRTLFGNYWISGPGWSQSEAIFQSHGS
ncbi:MAG: hypothetical protein ABIW03_04130 [Sphingomicrobium sp.]